MPEPEPVRQPQDIPEPESIRQPETTPQPETIQQPKTIPQPEAARQPQTSYQKVEIQDIRKLPKSNWNLCNNRFLLHGFFNYHYLMLKTLEMNGEKRQFLGIPGIYEQPERMMAMLFGFPRNSSVESCNTDIAVLNFLLDAFFTIWVGLVVKGFDGYEQRIFVYHGMQVSIHRNNSPKAKKNGGRQFLYHTGFLLIG